MVAGGCFRRGRGRVVAPLAVVVVRSAYLVGTASWLASSASALPARRMDGAVLVRRAALSRAHAVNFIRVLLALQCQSHLVRELMQVSSDAVERLDGFRRLAGTGVDPATLGRTVRVGGAGGILDCSDTSFAVIERVDGGMLLLPVSTESQGDDGSGLEMSGLHGSGHCLKW